MYNIEGGCWILKQAGNLEGKQILEFGNQHVWEHAMQSLNSQYKVAKDWMVKQLKVKEYVSIDINGEDDSLVIDLTQSLEEKYNFLLNHFDIVTNIGSIEHFGKEFIEQWRAFCHAVSFAKPGGLILHQLPPENQWLDHCSFWYKDGLGNVLAETTGCDLIIEERINLPTLNVNVDYLSISLRKKINNCNDFSKDAPRKFIESLLKG